MEEEVTAVKPTKPPGAGGPILADLGPGFGRHFHNPMSPPYNAS